LLGAIQPVFEKNITGFAEEYGSATERSKRIDDIARTPLRKKIVQELRVNPNRTNSWIANIADSTDKYVEQVRNELQEIGEIPCLDELRGEDGRIYPHKRPHRKKEYPLKGRRPEKKFPRRRRRPPAESG
jgi:hypothetical protein